MLNPLIINMRKIATYTISGLAVLAVIFGIVKDNSNNVSLGSVARSNEYQSQSVVTATTQTGGLLCSNSGALGSVVITGAAAGVIEVYDASTTNGTLRTIVATTSLKKLATIPASTVAGTYTFDVVGGNGIVWERSLSATPTTTITYRCF